MRFFIKGVQKRQMICISVIGIVLATGCSLKKIEEQGIATSIMRPEEVTYRTMPVTRKDLVEEIRTEGRVVAAKQHHLYFTQESGHLRAIYVKEGQTVQKGDLLAELVQEDIEDQINEKAIRLRMEETAYGHSRKLKELDLWQLDLQRQRIQSEIEDMRKIPEVYPSRTVQDVEDSLEKLELQYQIKEKELEKYQREQQAVIMDLKQEWEELHEKKSEIKMIAPVEGTIERISDITVGESIQPYQILMTINDTNHLQIETTSTYAKSLRVGMHTQVQINDVFYEGIVATAPVILPEDHSANMESLARIEVQNLPAEVSIKDRVQIIVVINKREDVLWVPRHAIYLYNGKEYLYILEENTKKTRFVVTGFKNMQEVEILSGIQEGQVIVLD